jgi:macrolide-specific efflux system membrane fusion protein
MNSRWIGVVAMAWILLSLSGLEAQQARQRKKKTEPARPSAKLYEPNPKLVKVTAEVAGIVSPAFRLKVGDTVKAGDLLVQLENRLAEQDLLMKEAKLKIAAAELEGARAIVEEARTRWQINQGLVGCVAKEEVALTKVTYQKYYHEAIIKEQAVNLVKTEVQRARVILDLYQLRSPVNGVVRAIYKTRGEGVQALESVLLIEETGTKE